MLEKILNLNRGYKILLTSLLVLCLATVFIAAIKYKDAPMNGTSGKSSVSVLHENGNFWLLVWNTMYVGDVSGNSTGEWPGGSGVTYVYQGSIWVGLLDGADIKVISGEPNNDAEFVEQPPTTSSLLISTDDSWDDRPAGVEAVSDFDSWACADDSAAQEAGPIGIFVWQQGYSWGAPGHNDWIVMEYTVFNTSGHTLEDVYVANSYDMDVGFGDHLDDLVLFEGNDASLDNWTNPKIAGVPWTQEVPDGVPDENDYVNFNTGEYVDVGKPRMMSVMFDGGDESRDVPGYIGLRIMGLDVTAQHSWDINNDPAFDAYKYGYMIDTGTFEEITTPYDWRICPSMGPIEEVLDGGEIHWWTAIVMGNSLNGLRVNADRVYADYLGADGIVGTDDDWQVVSPPGSPRLVAVKGDGKVTLRWNPSYAAGKNTENDGDSRTNVVDFDGYVVWRSAVGLDIGWEPVIWIDKAANNSDMNTPWGWHAGERVPDGEWVDGVSDGHPYIEPDLRNIGTQIEYSDITTESAPVKRTTQGFYEWTDNSVVNGTRYYYAVTPYDFGSSQLVSEPVIAGFNSNATEVIPIVRPNVGSLDAVTVVPNPYRGSADWEEWTGTDVRLGKIWFMNLPKECTISIFTISGDPVHFIKHRSGEIGAVAWDLTGASGVQVASGIYVYQVETEDETIIGKLAVIIGQNG